MEAIIQLDLIARSQIDIFVEVLQVDGSEFCVAVNAATLALIDAGIPIKVKRTNKLFHLLILKVTKQIGFESMNTFILIVVRNF